MLGVYDYTVVLTYVSLMVSIGGMMFASELRRLFFVTVSECAV